MVVLAVLALVVWGAVALVAVVRDQLASGAGSAAAAEESAQGPVDPVACEPTAVAVSLSPEAGSAGAAVAFDLTARNTGEVACLLDAGRSSLVLSVRSGSDRVWSSGDCAAGSGSRNLLLAPGDSTSTSITWGGGRSSAGCAAVDGSVDAGTYRVHAALDGRVLPGSAETFTLR